jgi:hypothetical protein
MIAPRLLRSCCALAFVGAFVFAAGVVVDFAAPRGAGTAGILMLGASAAIVLAMVAATAVATFVSLDFLGGKRR